MVESFMVETFMVEKSGITISIKNQTSYHKSTFFIEANL